MTNFFNSQRLKKAAIFLLFTFAIIFLQNFPVYSQSGLVRPTPSPTPDPDDLKIATEEVRLNITAFDEDGQFVNDLTPADIVITDDNRIHQPTSLRRVPANILIMMDTGGELRYVKSLDRTRKIAANFISSLKQGDSVAILQYSDKPEIILEWTTNLELAKNSLKLANFGRRSSLVKAVDLAVDFLKKSNLDNKHLLLITDGTDSSNNQQTLRNTFRKLLGVDVSVHIISFAQAELLDLAERTKTISDSAPPKALPPEVIAQLPPGVRDTASAPKVGPTINVDRKMLNVLRERQRQLQNAQIDLQRLADDSNGELIDPVDVEQMLDKAAYIAKVVDSTYVVTYIPKLSVAESKRERIVSVSSKRNNVVITGTRKLLPPGQ